MFASADREKTSGDRGDDDDSVYSYASDDLMWRSVGRFLYNNDKRVSKYTKEVIYSMLERV